MGDIKVSGIKEASQSLGDTIEKLLSTSIADNLSKTEDLKLTLKSIQEKQSLFEGSLANLQKAFDGSAWIKDFRAKLDKSVEEINQKSATFERDIASKKQEAIKAVSEVHTQYEAKFTDINNQVSVLSQQFPEVRGQIASAKKQIDSLLEQGKSIMATLQDIEKEVDFHKASHDIVASKLLEVASEIKRKQTESK